MTSSIYNTNSIIVDKSLDRYNNLLNSNGIIKDELEIGKKVWTDYHVNLFKYNLNPEIYESNESIFIRIIFKFNR